MPTSTGYAQAYARQAAKTLPPRALPGAALTGVLAWIGQAQRAIAVQDVPGAHHALLTAQQIVSTLRASLDPAPAPELVRQLQGLYDYLLRELAWANVHKDGSRLEDVVAVVGTLRDAFEQASSAVSRGPEATKEGGGRP